VEPTAPGELPGALDARCDRSPHPSGLFWNFCYGLALAFLAVGL
jgi:hypothetical protein